jgi:hypothetical protein
LGLPYKLGYRKTVGYGLPPVRPVFLVFPFDYFFDFESLRIMGVSVVYNAETTAAYVRNHIALSRSRAIGGALAGGKPFSAGETLGFGDLSQNAVKVGGKRGNLIGEGGRYIFNRFAANRAVRRGKGSRG